jgi:hypothetical protein
VNYICRVELHGARTEEDYVRLHEEMAKTKFYFVIMGGTGDTPLRLPTGTYFCYETYPDANTAHASVTRAAARTGFAFSAITAATGPGDWQASGLAVLPKA